MRRTQLIVCTLDKTSIGNTLLSVGLDDFLNILELILKIKKIKVRLKSHHDYSFLKSQLESFFVCFLE